jgi:hypothetical protein
MGKRIMKKTIAFFVIFLLSHHLVFGVSLSGSYMDCIKHMAATLEESGTPDMIVGSLKKGEEVWIYKSATYGVRFKVDPDEPKFCIISLENIPYRKTSKKKSSGVNR